MLHLFASLFVTKIVIHHAAKFSALPKRALRQVFTINVEAKRLSREGFV